jgi:hypothetical protein
MQAGNRCDNDFDDRDIAWSLLHGIFTETVEPGNK